MPFGPTGDSTPCTVAESTTAVIVSPVSGSEQWASRLKFETAVWSASSDRFAHTGGLLGGRTVTVTGRSVDLMPSDTCSVNASGPV